MQLEDDAKVLRTFNDRTPTCFCATARRRRAGASTSPSASPAIPSHGDVRDVDPHSMARSSCSRCADPSIEDADEEDPPNWNYLGIRPPTTAAASRDRHPTRSPTKAHDVRRTTCPTAASCSPRRASGSRGRSCSTRASRSSRPGRGSQRGRVRAARHECRRHGIHQISFNQSHDLDPSVLADGRIVFSRWDHASGQRRSSTSTASIRTAPTCELLYGAHSHDTGTDRAARRPVPASRAPMQRRPRSGAGAAVHRHRLCGGDLRHDRHRELRREHRSRRCPTRRDAGPGADAAPRPMTCARSTVPPPGGRYQLGSPAARRHRPHARELDRSAALLEDDAHRAVHARPPCESGRRQTAPPLYGIWIYDPSQNTQLPVVRAGRRRACSPTSSHAAAAHAAAGDPRPRRRRRFRCGRSLTEGVGILDIRSVYDIDGVDTAPGGIAARARSRRRRTPQQRPARFLRIEKAVSHAGR